MADEKSVGFKSLPNRFDVDGWINSMNVTGYRTITGSSCTVIKMKCMEIGGTCGKIMFCICYSQVTVTGFKHPDSRLPAIKYPFGTSFFRKLCWSAKVLVKSILTGPWSQVNVPVYLYPFEKPDDTKSTTKIKESCSDKRFKRHKISWINYFCSAKQINNRNHSCECTSVQHKNNFVAVCR